MKSPVPVQNSVTIYKSLRLFIRRHSLPQLSTIKSSYFHQISIKFIHYSSNFFRSKMNFRKTSTLLIIFLISVAILSHARVEAARVLSEDFSSANNLETYSSIYERAKHSMAYWLERLPSGPSPGDGH
jgi:hypothetical protein